MNWLNIKKNQVNFDLDNLPITRSKHALTNWNSSLPSEWVFLKSDWDIVRMAHIPETPNGVRFDSVRTFFNSLPFSPSHTHPRVTSYSCSFPCVAFQRASHFAQSGSGAIHFPHINQYVSRSWKDRTHSDILSNTIFWSDLTYQLHQILRLGRQTACL